MTNLEWKKVARILKEAYKELEGEALSNGIDIFSDEYKKLQDTTRELVLKKLGYTLEEYRQMKEEVASANKKQVATQIAEISQQVKDIPQPVIPTTEEIAQIARNNIPAPIITHNTTNEIVKEITHEKIIEKPQIIETIRVTRETYDDKPIRKELKRILQQLDEIKIPEQISIEKLKKELKSDFSVFFEHNINTLDMPNFRKLAMGLQGQIDALGTGGGGTWGSITGTLSSQTDLQWLELQFPHKAGYGLYSETTYDGSNQITNVDYWSDSGKGTKLFSEVTTWVAGLPTVTTITDEINGKVRTITNSYTGSTYTGATDVIA